jgi:putative addiction module killer protein
VEITVKQTSEFQRWHERLRDIRTKVAIGRRIERLGQGNFGDCKPVGEGVSELRVDVSAGYRAYLLQRGTDVVILLCDGSKKAQQTDIRRAKEKAAVL